MTHVTETYQEWSERMCREHDCEICGGSAGEVHNIARGANKARTRRELCAVLFVCRACHDTKIHNGMRPETMLAYLMLRRPFDVNMPRYYALTGRVFPSLADIDAAYQRIWNGINQRLKWSG